MEELSSGIAVDGINGGGKFKLYGVPIDSDKILNLIDLVKERVQFKKDIFNECIMTLEYSSSLFNNNIGFFKNIQETLILASTLVFKKK